MDWCRRHGRGRDAQCGAGGRRRATAARSPRSTARRLDLSRTVGWFTSLYPVRLDPRAIRRVDLDDALSGGDAIGRALKTVKEQLRALPDRGLGYGLLRYLNPQTAATLAALPAPQIGFNYLGRFAAPGSADWASAPEAVPLGGGDPGAGAGARDRGQCADARRRRRSDAVGDLDLGAGADVRTPWCATWRRAGSGR